MGGKGGQIPNTSFDCYFSFPRWIYKNHAFVLISCMYQVFIIGYRESYNVYIKWCFIKDIILLTLSIRLLG